MVRPRHKTKHADSRRQQLLEASARLFAARGYIGTSIRDIASEVGMLPGSLYYHFKSKEDLLLAVHGQGVSHIFDAVRRALDDCSPEPWARLEAASAAHLKALCENNHYALIVTPNFMREFDEPLRQQIIAQRDSYEKMFRALIDEVLLPEDVNPGYLRLSLFGALNWVTTWYRPGGDSLDKIARKIIDLYRRPLDTRNL